MLYSGPSIQATWLLRWRAARLGVGFRPVLRAGTIGGDIRIEEERVKVSVREGSFRATPTELSLDKSFAELARLGYSGSS